MTALNLLTGPEAAYLIADRATCSASGIVEQIGPKIHVASALSLAIATTGLATPGFGACEDAWLASMRSQTEVLRGLPGLLQELVGLLDVEFGKEGANEQVGEMPNVVTLVVAMWSLDRHQSIGFLCTSAHGHLPPRVPPFQPWPSHRYIQPEVPASYYPPQSSAIADGAALRLLEAQRTVPSPWGTNHVGGGVDMAICTAGGVELRQLHTWPDKIGAPISLVHADEASSRSNPITGLALRSIAATRRLFR